MSTSKEKQTEISELPHSELTDAEFLQAISEGYGTAEKSYALIEIFYLAQEGIMRKQAQFSDRQRDLHYQILLECSEMYLRAGLNQDR